MKFFRKQSGLTLIELMIAMILGLFVAGSIITIFISNVKSTSENMKMLHLNQELRVVMGFISDEIKKAGYSASSNPNYMDAFTLSDEDGDGLNDCIIYAYDENADGSGYDLNIDRVGFKWDGDTILWGKPVTSCDDSDGTWTALTDSTVADVTAFTLIGSDITAGTVLVKQLDITLTAETSLTPGTASRTFTETIRLRNDDAS